MCRVTGSIAGLMRKYLVSRVKIVGCSPLLLQLRNGKCVKQRVGQNTISSAPSNIADFLGLPEPNLYTGHALRRSAATILANTGANLTRIRRLGGWTSNVAEKYIVESEQRQVQNENSILGAIQQQGPPQDITLEPLPGPAKNDTEMVENIHPYVRFGPNSTITGPIIIVFNK